MIKDAWTSALNRALDFLFVKHPLRTSIGVVLGCVLAFFTILFKPILMTIGIADFAGAPWWGWVAFGILITHAPNLVLFVRTKPKSSEAIDELLRLIDNANFTPQERRQQHRMLIAKVLENLALNQRAAAELKATQRRIAETKSASRPE